MHEERILNSILLVDDEPDILTIADYALTKVGGFKVMTFSDSENAIEQVEELMPDMIILDVMMPKMDGIETLARLNNIKALSHVPVIFMTARVEENEISRYLDLGAIGVIHKPFDPMTLSIQVMKLWEQKYSGENSG